MRHLGTEAETRWRQREPGNSIIVDISKSLLLAASKILQLDKDTLNPDLNPVHYFPHESWCYSHGFLWHPTETPPPLFVVTVFLLPMWFWCKIIHMWTNVMDTVPCNHNDGSVYFVANGCCKKGVSILLNYISLPKMVEYTKLVYQRHIQIFFF